jgi:hypothetical protein
MKKYYALAFLFLSAPAIALGQATRAGEVTDFDSLTTKILSIADNLVKILIALAGLFFIYQIFEWVRADGNKKAEKAKTVAFSFLALFVLFTFWGIITIL